MAPTPYTVGIVGCGGMGRAHAAAYDADDRAAVAAAADMNDDVRAAFAEDYGIDGDATYETHADMLDAADLDVVSICT